MTHLDKPVRRVTHGALDYSYGADRGRRLVASLEVGDVLTLRPASTRRSETVSLFDVYRFALVRRVNCLRLEKARAKKAKRDIARRERSWQRDIRRSVVSKAGG